MPNVQCVNCGLVGVRNYETGELIEIGVEFREEAKDGVSLGMAGALGPNESICVCFINACPIHQKRSDEGFGSGMIGVELYRERECDSLVPYQPGRSPKEHLEMQALEEQRRWQEERLQADVRWREEQAQRAEARHREQVEQAEARHREQAEQVEARHRETIEQQKSHYIWHIIIFGAAVTAANIIAQIVIAMINK